MNLPCLDGDGEAHLVEVHLALDVQQLHVILDVLRQLRDLRAVVAGGGGGGGGATLTLDGVDDEAGGSFVVLGGKGHSALLLTPGD